MDIRVAHTIYVSKYEGTVAGFLASIKPVMSVQCPRTAPRELCFLLWEEFLRG